MVNFPSHDERLKGFICVFDVSYLFDQQIWASARLQFRYQNLKLYSLDYFILVLLWDVLNHYKADRKYGKESLKDLVKIIIKQKLLEYPNYDANMFIEEPTTKNTVHDFMLQPSDGRLFRY